MVLNTESLRMLSQVFSPPVFKKIVRTNNSDSFSKKIQKHLKVNDEVLTNHDLISRAYNLLLKDYRCEYIYKNKLFTEIVRKYGLERASVFNEFRIGSSKADLALFNGEIKIYEIKTELDSLVKLDKQLLDYQKVANKVCIVSDEYHIKKLVNEYSDTNVGIILMSEKNKLEVVQEATDNLEYFEFDAMFKLLRKNEYIDLVQKNYNFIPDVPNTKIFTVCYELLSEIDLFYFQKQVLNILKKRKIKRPDLLKSRQTPKELKLICNSLDFNENEYEELYKFLNTEAYVSTLHQRETI